MYNETDEPYTVTSLIILNKVLMFLRLKRNLPNFLPLQYLFKWISDAILCLISLSVRHRISFLLMQRSTPLRRYEWPIHIRKRLEFAHGIRSTLESHPDRRHA